MTDNNKIFLKKAKEFAEEKGVEKFKRISSPKFSDGTFMGVWFDKRKKDICSSTLEICIRITKQYNEYLYGIDKKFDEKLKLFANEQNLDKFNYNKKTIKFNDGKLMSVWFITYKDLLFSSDNEFCRLIQKQYKEYQKEYQNNRYSKQQQLFLLHLKEFIESPNLDKFSEYKIVLFSDGKSMNSWYRNNKDILKDNVEIQKQHDMFIRNRIYEKKKCEAQSKIDFERKIQEFLSLKSLEKFKKFSYLKFSDGSLVGGWFNQNEKKLSINYGEQYLMTLEQKNEKYQKDSTTNFNDDKIISHEMKSENNKNGI